MVYFTTLIAAAAATTGVFAVPTEKSDAPLPTRLKRGLASGEGTSNGYFYSFYNQGGGTVDYNNGDAGEYSVTWTDDSDIVAGKGWATGAARDIVYSGTFTTTGNAYLSVYGWTTSPLVEYYICDSYGDYDPGSQLTHEGTVTSDGDTYDIYRGVQTDDASIEGTATFDQFWSIRQTHRVGGTITTSNHFDAWKKLGMDMGTFNYQILATEGYESSGSSSITVS